MLLQEAALGRGVVGSTPPTHPSMYWGHSPPPAGVSTEPSESSTISDGPPSCRCDEPCLSFGPPAASLWSTAPAAHRLHFIITFVRQLTSPNWWSVPSLGSSNLFLHLNSHHQPQIRIIDHSLPPPACVINNRPQRLEERRHRNYDHWFHHVLCSSSNIWLCITFLRHILHHILIDLLFVRVNAVDKSQYIYIRVR